MPVSVSFQSVTAGAFASFGYGMAKGTTNYYPLTAILKLDETLFDPTTLATAANQPSNVLQGSTTAPQTGLLSMMAIVASAPSFTPGQSQPLTADQSGALRVNAGASPLPVAPNFTTGQITVGNVATQIVGQRSGRLGVTIINKGTVEVDIGPTNAVTTATGSPLPPVAWASKTIITQSAIWGIVASGTQTVAFEELY